MIFSNGLLDPFYPAGVLHNLSESVTALLIPDAAHHLDLMFSNAADPASVLQARDFEHVAIQKWIAEAELPGKHWP